MRTMPLAITAALLLLLAATPAGVVAAPQTEDPPARASLGEVAALLDAEAGLGERLLSATLLGRAAPEIPALPEVSFFEAMRLLYAAAGVPVPEGFAPPPEPVASRLAPLVAATAAAVRLAEAAYADLDAQERAYLRANLHALPPGGARDARVESLAARIDVDALALGAALVAKAAERVDVHDLPPTLRWVEPTGRVEIGSTGDEVFNTERILLVDLGGNDDYTKTPAAYGPGSSLLEPVALVVDLGGNDEYLTSGPTFMDLTWGQGVGIVGLGLLVDRWGDDVYRVAAVGVPDACLPDDGAQVHRQMVYAQGVGVTGVGALLDASGNDAYEALSSDALPRPCGISKAYVFAQGAGLHRGAGALLDDTGDDRYEGHAESVASPTGLAHAHCQAVSAGGVGVLAEKEGHDAYRCRSDARGPTSQDPQPPGGASVASVAYVFGQASNLATREDASGPIIQCKVPSLTPALGWPGRCVRGGAALLVDVLGDDRFEARPTSVQPGTCSAASWAVSASQGASAWSGLAALLNLDVDGEDVFTARPFAQGGQCPTYGLRALSYAQGYGGQILWDPFDHPLADFLSISSAWADPIWTPPVGILASGGVPELTLACPEGLPGNPALVAPVAAAEIACVSLVAVLDPFENALNPVPSLSESPDRYDSVPWASSTTGMAAFAESRAQGVGGNLAFTTNPSLGAPMGPTNVFASAINTVDAEVGSGVGLGIHADVGGHDEIVSEARADSLGGFAFALSVAQGTGHRGVGLLANEGGDDQYVAHALQNGINVPTQTWAQGFARDVVPVAATSVCIVFPVVLCPVPLPPLPPLPSLGVLADAGGVDAYTEAAESAAAGFAPCQGNGETFGAWPTPPADVLGPRVWGNAPATFPVACMAIPAPGTFALGIDASSEIPF